VPDIVSSAPADDRCSKAPSGSHSWRPPTFPGFPHRCDHCAERREITVVDLREALRILTGGVA
jgi:hypothetical protein